MIPPAVFLCSGLNWSIYKTKKTRKWPLGLEDALREKGKHNIAVTKTENGTLGGQHFKQR